MRPLMSIAGIAAVAIGCSIVAARAQSTNLLPDQIEEDWKAVISSPSTEENGPQITTTMSPVGDNSSGPFVAFDLNYREYPDFTPGGMQIQVWDNGGLDDTSSSKSSQLNNDGETITWTQQMKLAGGTITYNINNGQSTTWGQFGQGNGLLAVNFSSSLASLAGYDPAVSIANSGATWQSNRVSSLGITQVRYYLGGNLIATDNTQRSCPLPP